MFSNVLKKYYKSKDEIFVIGGGVVYKQFLPVSSKLYLTLVQKHVKNADIFFPNYSKFKVELFNKTFEESDFRYTLVELTRKQKNGKNDKH